MNISSQYPLAMSALTFLTINGFLYISGCNSPKHTDRTLPLQTTPSIVENQLATPAVISPIIAPNISLGSSNWYTYRSFKGFYSVNFPGKPEQELYNIGNGSVEAAFYVDPDSRRKYSAASLDFGAITDVKLAPEKVLEYYTKHMFDPTIQTIKETRVNLNGYEGRELITQSLNDKGQMQITRAYVDLKKSKVYTVRAVVKDVNLNSPETQRFLNSFQINP